MADEKKTKKKKNEFWLDAIGKKIVNKFDNEKVLHLNCGLSIRGPQHIGRLRGELCIPSSVQRVLKENHGKKAIHYITLYDMDGMKAKGAKKGFPDDPKAQKQWTGVSLFNIPDPHGCHKNWQEHYWADFGDYLDQFGFDVEIVKTSDFYKMPATKEIVKWVLENREKVIEAINRFRARHPWPEDHIPINVICEGCLTIMEAKTVGFDLEKYTVDYDCGRCGKKGTTSLENAKLNWRLEWAALWKVLHVEFEPYGKDHAAAGSSRETCGVISKELFEYDPPIGEWNEWVSFKTGGEDMGEMTASGFVGITPKQWLEVAEPEVLKYLYIGTRPHTAITIDMDNLFVLFNDYDRAERIYLGEEETDERETQNIKRAFELSQVEKKNTVSKAQFKLDYVLAARIVQTLPEKAKMEKAINFLKKSGHLTRKPTKSEQEMIERRLEMAGNWVEKYAPAEYRLKENGEEKIQLSEKEKVVLAELIKAIDKEEDGEALQQKIFDVSEAGGMKTIELFRLVYQILFSSNRGPRLGPYIIDAGKAEIIKKLQDRI